jgi:MFS family permease
VAMTAVYAVATGIFPSGSRGVGFGVLMTGSLSGIALGPMLSGVVGAVSLRAVFAVNAVAMAVLAWLIARRLTARIRPAP